MEGRTRTVSKHAFKSSCFLLNIFKKSVFHPLFKFVLQSLQGILRANTMQQSEDGKRCPVTKGMNSGILSI